MNILIAIALLILGFVLLIKGADFFVEGASDVAKKFRVPPLIIGMTIVALGTSLPELSVSVTASLNNSNALAVSNVIGSNLFNLMVVLGASALISPMKVGRDTLKRDYPFSVICLVLLLVLGYIGMALGHLDGFIFLGAFVGFLTYEIKAAMNARNESAENKAENDKSRAIWLSAIFIIGGAAAVKFGGDLVVDGAVTIAKSFGLSENLIGLTIVACGTSLPELVTSLMAAKKNEADMAIGNVVGSNIFNILMILGVAAAISPIAFIMENVVDIAVLLAFSVMSWIFCKTKGGLDRVEGTVMLLCYAGYLGYICVR